MNGIIHIEDFTDNKLIEYLLKLEYDKSMKNRYTKSFGVPYNYSQINYDFEPIPEIFKELIVDISNNINYTPNNILINYYLDGKSKMGYHSDNVEYLKDGTGVCIISLGCERILRFKHKISNEIIDYNLKSGSLFYTNKEIQDNWLHCIPESNDKDFRFSLTFRLIENNI